MAKSKIVRQPIATWWHIASEYRAEIEPVEVVAITPAFITYLDRRWCVVSEQRTSRKDFFPTFADAKAEAIRRAERDVERDKESLQQSRSLLGQWQALKEPDASGNSSQKRLLI